MQWEWAKRSNSLSSYESFLFRYPNSKFSSQARTEIKNFAKVVVDFPESLKSQRMYYNINGPVWVFNIVFRETNGVAATILQKKSVIQGKDGRKWGDRHFSDIINSDSLNQGVVKINIPSQGTGNYTSWVNSQDCGLCDGTMYLDYKGTDANGHTVYVSKRFRLER